MGVETVEGGGGRSFLKNYETDVIKIIIKPHKAMIIFFAKNSIRAAKVIY